jgi:hypothetical protein
MAALLLAIFASSTAAAAPEPPIFVTGRAGPPFISPMGEPFRTPNGGVEAYARWFGRADRNRDGFIDSTEMLADADRFFAKLDTNHDGAIDPDELAKYEWEVAPEIQVNNKLKRPRSQMAAEPPPESETGEPRIEKVKRERFRDNPYDPYGLQGAARYALLNMPEPVAAADLDFNRLITHAEFRQAAMDRFAILAGKQGALGYQALAAMLPKLPKMGSRPKRPNADEADRRIGTPVPRAR